MKSRRVIVAALVLVGALAALLVAWFLSGWADVRARQQTVREAPIASANQRGAELARELRDVLAGVLEREVARPYFHYQNVFHDPRASASVGVTPSPLAAGPDDPLVLGHFRIDDAGRVTTPTINEDVPSLSEPTRLAGNTAFRNAVARTLAGPLTPHPSGNTTLVASVTKPAPVRPQQQTRQQAIQQPQVVQIDNNSFTQNNEPNFVYQQQRAAPNAPVQQAQRNAPDVNPANNADVQQGNADQAANPGNAAKNPTRQGANAGNAPATNAGQQSARNPSTTNSNDASNQAANPGNAATNPTRPGANAGNTPTNAAQQDANARDSSTTNSNSTSNRSANPGNTASNRASNPGNNATKPNDTSNQPNGGNAATNPTRQGANAGNMPATNDANARNPSATNSNGTNSTGNTNPGNAAARSGNTPTTNAAQQGRGNSNGTSNRAANPGNISTMNPADPGSASNPLVPVVVSAFEWKTLPFEGTPTLVAVRSVQMPDRALAQGFVVDRSTLTSWLASRAGESVAELRTDTHDKAASHADEATTEMSATEIAPGWHLAVSPNPHAIVDADDEATHIEHRFVLRFAVVGVVAALAAVFVVLLVARSEALARERSQFAAAAAHELRTPLAGLQLYGDMLADGLGDPAKMRDYARRMSEEASRLGRVVSNVLGFSQLERGNLSVEARVGPLGEALRELADRARPALDRAGATLELEVRDVDARFDRDALARIVANLLDNAEKYSRGAEDRTIDLVASEQGDGVEIAVADRGPGVDVRGRAALFQPFKRGVNADGPAGLGLGLALSQSLARAMDGDLAYRPTPEGGATFVLRLAKA